MAAPVLTPEAVREELERLYRGTRNHHLVAFHGTGTEASIIGDRCGAFRIQPVRSELELRAEMPPLGGNDARVAFLVPWQGEVPLDLASRFLDHGRVQSIGPERRLAVLCGAREVDAEAARSPLARYLLRPGAPGVQYSAAGGRVTQEHLWRAWLKSDWGLETDGGIAADELLVWAAFDGHGRTFVGAMEAPEAVGVRAALLGYLEAALGPVGPVIWQAWEYGRGRTLLELGLLCETLATEDDAGVRVWLEQRFKTELGLTDLAATLPIAQRLGRAAPLALRLVERTREGEHRKLLAAADALVDSEHVARALGGSDRLPRAWSLRLDAFGRALVAAVASPTPEAFTVAAQAFDSLERHALFNARGSREPTRADMALRLLAWLVVRPELKHEPGASAYADAEHLGRWYVEEGGFVDWARRWARGSVDSGFGRGAQAVAAAADAAREELDARFARALQAWIEAGRPRSQGLGIDTVLERIAVRFLDLHDERKLLVLLMDGMAWAQAVELLQSLEGFALRWGPIAWHDQAETKQQLGEARYPVVFAALPTTTEVSRAAFFGGRVPPSGSPLATAKDEERFADFKPLHRFCSGTLAPRLLLRGDGHTGDGSASSEAVSLIKREERRIVGIVINAIDSSLKGDPQADLAWTVDRVRSLPDLLAAARDAGRTVLMVADHGHVPADNLKTLSSPAKAGARWRAWTGEHDALQTGERRFQGEGVYVPKGADGVVLLENDRLRYGSAPHAGEHGGATLAEVVAPCVLLHWALADSELRDDPALAVRPPHVPAWWNLEVAAPTPVAAPAAAPPTGKKRPNEAQLGLPGMGAEPPPTAPARSAFADCPVLKARAPSAERQREVVAAVEFLLQRQGTVTEAAFAQHMGLPAYRVSGLISNLQEVLNVDGYDVLHLEAKSRQVVLYRERLEQQFEVKL